VEDTTEISESASDQGFHHPIRRLHARLRRNLLTRLITKLVVTLVGLGAIGAGLVMLVAPGPGIVAILFGLGVLSLEYHWAERWMHALRARAHAAAQRARAVDPAVRRRRLALAAVALALVATGAAAYVKNYGWPQVAIRGWDWVQGLSSVIPELPGM
jgi:uncharacterized protein (TIGR02611 family)